LTKMLPTVFQDEFHDLQMRFAQWRRTRRAGTPIPPALWRAAVTTARQHGVSRTARALHLDAHKLKTMMDTSAHTQSATAPTFVELIASPVQGGMCVLEVEGPRGGRLRLQLTGQGLPDVVALSRVIWGSEA